MTRNIHSVLNTTSLRGIKFKYCCFACILHCRWNQLLAVCKGWHTIWQSIIWLTDSREHLVLVFFCLFAVWESGWDKARSNMSFAVEAVLVLTMLQIQMMTAMFISTSEVWVGTKWKSRYGCPEKEIQYDASDRNPFFCLFKLLQT